MEMRVQQELPSTPSCAGGPAGRREPGARGQGSSSPGRGRAAGPLLVAAAGAGSACSRAGRQRAGHLGGAPTTLPGPTSSLTATPPVAAASWKRPSWPSPRGHPPVAAAPWPLLPASLCGSHFKVKLLEQEPGSLPAARLQGHPDGQIWGQHSSQSEHRLRSQTRLN